MNKEQIIKALECCQNQFMCSDCECANFCDDFGTLACSVIDIINRQKAEIERLRSRDEELLLKNYSFDKYYGEHITKAKSEAIKEFAERLKSLAYTSNDWSHGTHPDVVEVENIDNVLEEMTEG